MNKSLPNLELVLYKAQQIVSKNETFIHAFDTTYKAAKDKGYNIIPDFDIEVFSQTWASTATGFDEPGTMAGQAITDAYTTVVHERITDMFVVFFDNRPCYLVDNPNETFMDDLAKHRLKSVSEAKEAY